MISTTDIELVATRCADVPSTSNEYIASDFVCALLATVLDFRMHSTAVVRSERHFIDNRWSEVRTLDDLQRCLARWPDDKDGNTKLAQFLWANNHWTRAHMLRELVDFLDSQCVGSLEALRQWAARSDFKRDFEGKVKGLGPAVYQWLVMRMGVETVKPDVHLRRFVEATLARRVSDDDIVEVISAAAQRLGMRARELDASIWEYQRAQ
ncbi:MAG: hypothetical protein ACT4OX_13060 [Actinomycetota bacterium]